MSSNNIIDNALELPIEQRVILADALTQSLNPMDKEIETSWIQEARSRLQALEEGRLQTISFDEFFTKVD